MDIMPSGKKPVSEGYLRIFLFIEHSPNDTFIETENRIQRVGERGARVKGVLGAFFIFPDGTSSKDSARQCGNHRRYRFHPWVRKIPWRWKWQPAPVFLPGKSHEQRSLVGCSPRVTKSELTWAHRGFLKGEMGGCSVAWWWEFHESTH